MAQVVELMAQVVELMAQVLLVELQGGPGLEVLVLTEFGGHLKKSLPKEQGALILGLHPLAPFQRIPLIPLLSL
jgi:hypothetical protein